MHFAEGLVLGLPFQLVYMAEGTEFPRAKEEGILKKPGQYIK